MAASFAVICVEAMPASKCCQFVLERCCRFIFEKTWVRISINIQVLSLDDERTSEKDIRESCKVSIEGMVSVLAVVFARNVSACGAGCRDVELLSC